jgi:hypothetical protein
MHAIATMLEAVSAVSTASAVPSQAVQQVGPMCQGITALSGPAEAEAHAAASSVSSPSSAASCATYQLCAALVSAAAGRRTSHGPNKVGTVSGPFLGSAHSRGPLMQHAASMRVARHEFVPCVKPLLRVLGSSYGAAESITGQRLTPPAQGTVLTADCLANSKAYCKGATAAI